MPGAYLWGFDTNANKWVKCKVTAAGKLIINPEGFLENPPTEDEDKKAATSEWSFDHDADVAAHHAKFTAAEARAAINNVIGADGKFDVQMDMDHNKLYNVDDIVMKATSAATKQFFIDPSAGSAIVYIRCWEPGTGWIACTWEIYNGSNYQTIMTTETVDSKITDHAGVAAAHHAKYTDAEAVWSFYNRKKILSAGTYSSETLTNISMLEFDTSGGDITLQGFDNGLYGQIVFCVKPTSANDVHIIHNSGAAAAGDKIFTQSAGDESLAAGGYGGFWMIYFGGNWLIGHAVP